MLDTLAKHGVEPIAALGQPFDPNFHEAIIQKPDAEQPEGTVVNELGKGYRIRTRVLRPSKVAVSVRPPRDRGRNRGEHNPDAGPGTGVDIGDLVCAICHAAANRPNLSARRLDHAPVETIPMPTYDYICDACGHEFEAYESIKADPQTMPRLPGRVAPAD